MLKMSTNLVRHNFNGPTMGTRWSATFYTDATFDDVKVKDALQHSVDEIDEQMSTWKPQSDLMLLNAAPIGEWVRVPQHLLEVLQIGIGIGNASNGAFDIAMGNAVTAWGFGPEQANADEIRKASATCALPSHRLLELDAERGLARKHGPLTLDLNGIAKGYGVDRLAAILAENSIFSALVGIDGEMRAIGTQLNDEPWTIAVEVPDPTKRAPHSILVLVDGAVATSGDYRHWVEVQGKRLSHTMNPQSGKPVIDAPASVTVVAETCVEADAWATALMVLGVESGKLVAEQNGINALFLSRQENGKIVEATAGRFFDE